MFLISATDLQASQFLSRDKNCDACRSVALMRNIRGGYPLGKDDQLARERRTSRTEKI